MVPGDPSQGVVSPVEQRKCHDPGRGRRPFLAPAAKHRHRRRFVSLILGAALSLVYAPSAHAGGGPKLGDHWHMAFGIWNCGTWEPPPVPGDDPLGIHTHGEGLIHIHPFVSAATGDRAVLGAFFKVEKINATAKALQTGGKTLTVGSICKGKKTSLRTLLWDTRSTKTPRIVPGDPTKIPLRDGATVVLAFGPADENVGLPPSFAELEDPADLAPPPLAAKALRSLPAPPSAIPTVITKGRPPVKLQTVDRIVGTGAALAKNDRPYVRFALYLWRTGALLDRSSWVAGEQPLALQRLGKGRLLPGLDKGILGMKVGGIREIVIPPLDGFEAQGSPPVRGTDTLVMVVQLVSVSK